MHMRAEMWAVLTACCWAVGSLLEKKGVKLGDLSPVMGTAVRTFVSLLLLTLVSLPYLPQLKAAGVKPLLLIAVGGGLLSGGLGIVFLYAGLKSGQISTVMTIAFCLAPVIGAVLGWLVLHERLSPLQVLGIALCVTGASLTVYFRQPA
jgi:transporter family protein